jgi:DNA-binding beta-propeller fold protein YncE
MATFPGLAMSISIATATVLIGAGRPIAQTDNSAPLQLESRIPLGDVRGRIDHMAIDLARQRLFVAELGNDTVGIVDLKKREVIQTISGLKEPQGLGYVPAMDALYVANAGDGSVRVFAGADYAAAGRIDLGEDADNIRVDSAASQIVVGYGSGGLAVIDAKTLQRIADIPLPVHPEGFQLDPTSSQVFVNLPKVHAIAAADRQSGKLTASWPITIAGYNFPMALRRDVGQILTVFRNPAKLAAFSIKDGALLASADVCGDADDLFFDPKRERVYVSCGEGFLDVLDAKADSAYRQVARIATVPGARTSLFVPELDRLLLAVRAEAEQPASIWVFRPTP